MNKQSFTPRGKEDFIPRFNYITLTANRSKGVIEWDSSADISEYQTVLSVGDSVTDLKPGDKIKFERTAFPMKEVPKNPNLQKAVAEYTKLTQDRLDAIKKSKGKAADKRAKEEEIKFEFQDKVQEMQETGKAYAIPVMTDDYGAEFLWVSDRSVMFKFA